MEKITKYLEYVENCENWFFSYFVSKNQHLVYIFKLCIIFFFGTLIPGYVFMVIEAKAENPITPFYLEEQDRRFMLDQVREIKANTSTMDEFIAHVDPLLEYYRELIVRSERSKTFVRNNRGLKVWTLWNSIVYAGTVYTTLGYGELTPNTNIGRLLTMIYALVGIPLFLIALTDFGRFITLVIKFLWSFVRRLYYTGSCRKRRKIVKDDPISRELYDLTLGLENERSISTTIEKQISTTTQAALSEDTATTPDLSTFEVDIEFDLPISLSIFLLSVYMFISALVYSHWERWSFFESFYFIFITLSTIGFGDYIPHHPFCQVISVFIIFFGLALCTILIVGIQKYFDKTFQEGDVEPTDVDSFYGSEDDDSMESIDILNLDKDDSVQRIIKMEEDEEVKMGIHRMKSRAFRMSRSLHVDYTSNINKQDATVKDKRQKN